MRTEDEIDAALYELAESWGSCGPYVDYGDSNDIILDGHFTARQIIAMADVLKGELPK